MRTRVTSVGLVVATPSRQALPQLDIAAADLAALPNAPGIYIFRDDKQRPLYVGKSVTLRNRVLSHLRNPEEAKMLAASRSIEHQRTAGELGALLLEARLIKQLQPPFNRMLRQQRTLCSLQLVENAAPRVVFATKYDFSRTRSLFGLFSGKSSAISAYRQLIDEHGLCPVLCGLEKAANGRACFSHQLGRCRGACAGVESPTQHQARLLAAMHDWQLLVWPFEAAVGIVEVSQETDGEWRQMHIVDHWCYLGTLDARQAQGWQLAASWLHQEHRFDVDTYRILLKPILSGELKLEIAPSFCQPV